MQTIEEALELIWDKLHAYAETCLENKIGQDEDSMEHAEAWAEVCEAMAHITESIPQLNNQDN